MASITIDVPGALAPDQITAVADILADAVSRLQRQGFDLIMIAGLLREASFSLLDASAGSGADPLNAIRAKAIDIMSRAVDETIAEDGEEVDIIDAIAELPEIKALERFDRRISAIDAADRRSRQFDDAMFARAIEGISCYREALQSVQKMGAAKDLPLILDREAWRAKATDSELDAEDEENLFLDEIHILAYPSALTNLIDHVIIAAGIARNTDALDRLAAGLQSVYPGIDIEENLLDKTRDAVRRYDGAVRAEFDAIAGGKTVPMNDWTASLKMPFQLTEAWIEEALEEGRIAKVKKGRWLLIPARN